MNALPVQISVCVACLVAINFGDAEEASKKPAAAHFYYATYRGNESKGSDIVGRFELLNQWDYYEGLKSMDRRVISVPMYPIERSSPGGNGWLRFEPGSPENTFFWKKKGGDKHACPDPLRWFEYLDGTKFDATVSSVVRAEEGRTKVELLVFSGGGWSKGGPYIRGRKPEGSVSTIWDDSRGPVPVSPGQNVSAKINPSREVLLIQYPCTARFWRKAPDGLIEIAATTKEDPRGDQFGLLLLKPTGMNRSEHVRSVSTLWDLSLR